MQTPDTTFPRKVDALRAATGLIAASPDSSVEADSGTRLSHKALTTMATCAASTAPGSVPSLELAED